MCEFENKVMCFVSGDEDQKPLVDSQEIGDEDKMFKRAFAMHLEAQMESDVEKKD